MLKLQSRILKRFFGEYVEVVPPTDVVPVEYHLTETKIGEVRQRKNGKFILLTNGNEVVAEYSRYRDAIRGADRRGINVVPVS